MFCGIKSYKQNCSKCSLSVLTQAHNGFVTRLLLAACLCLLPCRHYVVRSQPRNPLFRCVKSLLSLWKPRSWFLANRTFLSLSVKNWIRSIPIKIISECCELAKFSYISCVGVRFLETPCIRIERINVIHTHTFNMQKPIQNMTQFQTALL